MELICDNNYYIEKADQGISAGWALDPVHPTKHIYAKAAFNLIEKIASGNKPLTAGQTGTRKRTCSASNRSDQDGGTQGGDVRGGGHRNSNQSTNRSKQWPEVRRSGGGGGNGGGWTDNRPHQDGRYGTEESTLQQQEGRGLSR
jgi:hypothetical protein